MTDDISFNAGAFALSKAQLVERGLLKLQLACEQFSYLLSEADNGGHIVYSQTGELIDRFSEQDLIAGRAL
jgi:hypothetical protein